MCYSLLNVFSLFFFLFLAAHLVVGRVFYILCVVSVLLHFVQRGSVWAGTNEKVLCVRH